MVSATRTTTNVYTVMQTLAIGFHQGALDSLKSVLPQIDTWLLPIDKNEFYYNMTHEKAAMLWEKHEEKFNSYDVIITTDTTPLCRIFLQGDYRGRLVIWICNRFDYAADSFVFDKEYYDLLEKANFDNNVRIAAYSKYDRVYAFRKNIYVDEIIKPVFEPMYNEPQGTYYIPDYQNNYTFHLSEKLRLPHRTGRHADEELKTFQAVVHLPYHWQGVGEQNALRYCVPYYVPSKQLLFNLIATGKYWFQNQADVYKLIDLCNFYDKENRAVFYFDSLDDIKPISIDRQKIFEYAERLYLINKVKWENLLWN